MAGKGGFETWKIPLNPPLLKGDFKSSQKQVWEKKSIIRCKLFPAPLSKTLRWRGPFEPL
ncbi:MAG: hypothetical protein AMJ91_08305 [candidate division Zixibacteria bacterium SM23_73_3]|nr:MAG: hypothetical protein AMJ91_08305 [candidate division Zixibacteria bacterium SM23_73_3]